MLSSAASKIFLETCENTLFLKVASFFLCTCVVIVCSLRPSRNILALLLLAVRCLHRRLRLGCRAGRGLSPARKARGPAGLSLGPARPGFGFQPAHLKNPFKNCTFQKKKFLILGQIPSYFWFFVSFFLIQLFIPARPGSGPRASPARPARSISKKARPGPGRKFPARAQPYLGDWSDDWMCLSILRKSTGFDASIFSWKGI